MNVNIPCIALLAATLATLTAVPSAAQNEPDHVLLDTKSLSAALNETWQPGCALEEEQRNPSLFRDIARDYGRFFTTRKTYVTLGLGLGASLSVKPLDEDIRNSRFNLTLPGHEDGRLDEVFEPGHILGGFALQVGGAFATYGIGSWIGKPGVTELGRDLVRVQLLTQGITQIVKRTVRRTRPDGSNLRSFPSGHVSGSFASATVLNRHFGWKVGVPVFGLASYVGASRIAHNRHFLSDVVFGATIGLAAGHTVTFDRGSTRFELSPVAAPSGAAVQVSVSKFP